MNKFKMCAIILTALLLAGCTNKPGISVNDEVNINADTLVITSEIDNTIHDKIIVGVDGIKDADTSYDMTSFKGAIEVADVIILGTIDKVEDIQLVDEISLPNFTYKVKIEKIYYDRESVLPGIGEYILYGSSCGYMKALDYQEQVQKTSRGRKFGIANGEYKENEYFAFEILDSLAYEEGYTYVMYLGTDKLNETGMYRDATYGQACRVSGDELRLGNGLKTVYNGTLDKLENEIYEALKYRTGEVDLGFEHYRKIKEQEIEKQEQLNQSIQE